MLKFNGIEEIKEKKLKQAKEKLIEYLKNESYTDIVFIKTEKNTFENKRFKYSSKAGNWTLRSGKTENFLFQVKNFEALDETYDFIYDVKITKFNDIYGNQTKYNFNIKG